MTQKTIKQDYIECGDCLNLMKSLPDGCIDLTVTSPPYDNLRAYKGYSFNFEPIASELYRITKPGGVLVWVVGDSTVNGSESGTSFKQALYFMEVGFNLHDTMIYQKANYIPLTHNRYEQSFEYMFVFTKGKPKTFNPILVPCKNAGKFESYGADRRSALDSNQAMRAPEGKTYMATKDTKIHPNIFTYTLGTTRSGHPAPFPDKLALDHILSWSNKGDVVFDPFLGSGTTAKMASLNGRHYIGFEISPDYVELAKKRLSEDYFADSNIGPSSAVLSKIPQMKLF